MGSKLEFINNDVDWDVLDKLMWVLNRLDMANIQTLKISGGTKIYYGWQWSTAKLSDHVNY